MSSMRSHALQIPHHTQPKLSFNPSYHTPGSPTIRKHVPSEYLSQPLLGEAEFLTGNGPDVNEAEVAHGKTKRRFRMPKLFAIFLILLACFVIVGVIFGIVSAEVFVKRGYFKRASQMTTNSAQIRNVPFDTAPVAMAPPDSQDIAVVSTSLVASNPVVIPPENQNLAPLFNAFSVEAPVVNEHAPLFPVPFLTAASASSSPTPIHDPEFSNLLQALRLPGPLHKVV